MIICQKLYKNWKIYFQKKHLLENHYLIIQLNYFFDLAAVINEINDTDDINAAIETAKLQLDKNPNHISALYANGLLNLKISNYSDMSLDKLLGIFKNAKKWNIVEFIAQKILDEYYESDYALRYLASYYQSTNREAEALEIWERLIRFDVSNPELPEKISTY